MQQTKLGVAHSLLFLIGVGTEADEPNQMLATGVLYSSSIDGSIKAWDVASFGCNHAIGKDKNGPLPATHTETTTLQGASNKLDVQAALSAFDEMRGRVARFKRDTA
jgi:lysophospholipid acyltransferase (LPLAT)-like uncharacterized protein